MATRKGNTLFLDTAPSVISYGAVGSKKESEGPLAAAFDRLWEDSTLGEETWEKAECRLQKEAIRIALEKGELSPKDLQVIFAGDLLNQCTSSTYGLRELGVPFIGLYGACSTMAESLALAALFIRGVWGAGRRHHLLPLLLGGAAVSLPPGVRRPAHPHLPVDRYRIRSRHPGEEGRPALCPGGDHRHHHRYGHYRRQQHGGGHGPRRLRDPEGPL